MFFKKEKKNECLHEFISITGKNKDVIINTKYVQMVTLDKTSKEMKVIMQNGLSNTADFIADEAFNQACKDVDRIFCNSKDGE